MLWRKRLHKTEPDMPSVWLRLRENCASESPAMPLENVSAGGPQLGRVLIVPGDSRIAGNVGAIFPKRFALRGHGG